MLYCYSKAQPGETELTGFRDHASVSPWAVDTFRWAVGAKIINGINGLLPPQGMLFSDFFLSRDFPRKSASIRLKLCLWPGGPAGGRG